MNEAVAALYAGKCPADCAQVAFLKTKIKQLACNRARNSKKAQEALERFINEQAEEPVPEMDHVTVGRQLYDRVIEVLGRLADERAKVDAKYSQVSLLVCAFGDRLETAQERREVAGFETQGEYDAAIKRMRTLLGHLPEDLRLAAIAYLRDPV